MIEGKLAIVIGFLHSNLVTTGKENDSTNAVNRLEWWQPYASGRAANGRRQRQKKRSE